MKEGSLTLGVRPQIMASYAFCMLGTLPNLLGSSVSPANSLYMYACIRIYVYIHIYIYIYIYTCTKGESVCVWSCLCVHVCLSVCLSVCLYSMSSK